MKLHEFTSVLTRPESVTAKHAELLEDIVTEFPYLQSARALRLKGLYNQNSFQYNYALKVAAAYTTDRSVLFDFITSDTFSAIDRAVYEKKQTELHNIDVKSAEILKEVSPVNDAEKLQRSILISIKQSEQPDEVKIPEENFETNHTPPPVLREIPEDNVVVDSDRTAPAEEINTMSEQPREIDYHEFVPAGVNSMDFVAADTPGETGVEQDPIVHTETEKPLEVVAAEEKLEIGKPLAFTAGETHSFSEWLKLSSFKPIVRDDEHPEAEADNELETTATESETVEMEQPAEEAATEAPASDPEKVKKLELIDKFIETNPKIPPITIKPDAPVAAVVEPFRDETAALMTETLARVYLEQKKYQKAIQAYEILILKYPEKSSFFADRISEIKKLQQNNLF